MKIAQTHPIYKYIVAIGCIFGAITIFLYQGGTSSEGIAGDNPSGEALLWASLIGYSLNFLEAGIVAFIAAPMAGKVSDILANYGFKQGKDSIQKLERIIDGIGLFALAIVYTFDAVTTYQGGVRRGYSKSISAGIAIIQLPMFEIQLNVGLWLLDDARIQWKILKKIHSQTLLQEEAS